MYYKILELYSGLGGMHCAWNETGLKGEVVLAVDINTVANEVYKSNFPETKLWNRNIQSLSPAEINNLDINAILMSPPCQPFTRNGNQMDCNDPRTNSFIYVIEVLDQLTNIECLLLENVKGFEDSKTREYFIEKLVLCDYNYQEFLVCPTSVGVPNSRLRYYCVARNNKSRWPFKRKEVQDILHSLPKDFGEPFALREIMQDIKDDGCIVPPKMLKRANILDICYKESKRSCCFTKAYTHYVEGTGSVFTNADAATVERIFKAANEYEVGSEDFIEILKPLKMRFFTPDETLRLMCFPKDYVFPPNITVKQCYRLIGNSVNVKVISELIKLIFS